VTHETLCTSVSQGGRLATTDSQHRCMMSLRLRLMSLRQSVARVTLAPFNAHTPYSHLSTTKRASRKYSVIDSAPLLELTSTRIARTAREEVRCRAIAAQIEIGRQVRVTHVKAHLRHIEHSCGA
jgi:hypothetical protein